MHTLRVAVNVDERKRLSEIISEAVVAIALKTGLKSARADVAEIEQIVTRAVFEAHRFGRTGRRRGSGVVNVDVDKADEEKDK